MKRRRVTVSPSKAPGMFRSAVYLDLGCLRDSGTGAGILSTRPPRGGAPKRQRASIRRRAIAAWPAWWSGARTAARRPRRPRPRRRRRARDRPRRAPGRTSAITSASSATASRSPSAASRRGRARRGDRRPAAPGRGRRAHDAAGAVVLQVALADRLDEQRVGLAARRRRPSPCGCGAAPSLARRVAGEQAALRRAARRPAARARVMRDLRERRGGGLERAGDVLGRVRRATGTRPRTATAAGRRRGPAARGTRRRRPRCRRRRRRRSPRGGLGGEEDGQQARASDVTETGRSPGGLAQARRRARAVVSREPRGRPARRAARASRGRRRPRAGSRSACRPGRRRRPGAIRSISAAEPPKAAAGSPPPMILPITVRSGSDAGQLLRAARGDAEAGDHLVEDEQRAVARCRGRAAARGSPRAGGTRPMLAG